MDDRQSGIEGVPQIGELVAGKYLVKKVLGVGGMGAVVAAEHVQLRHTVAIKFLLPGVLDQVGAVERFLREARASVKLRSEHVVRVTDVDTLPTGVPYVVMELLAGRDLGDEVEARGPLPIAEAIHYVLQACDAVAEAHSIGLVHRDLKPANLFLTTRSDGRPLVKVLDSGIVKTLTGGTTTGQQNLTATNVMMGSPVYMSPEQVRSAKHVDARSDVWALGVILYQLLAGAVPFNAGSVLGVCTKILTEPPVPPRPYRPDLPADLEAAILACLEKDAALRPQTVGALAQVLAPFASPESLSRVEPAARIAGTPPALRAASPAAASPASLRQPVPAPTQESAPARSAPVDPPAPELAPARSAAVPRPSPESAPARSAPVDLPGRGPAPPPIRRQLIIGLVVIPVVVFGIVLAYKVTRPLPRPRSTSTGVPTGSLYVTSKPAGAAISINGKPTGRRTPDTLDELPANRSLKLELAVDGYQPWSLDVSVSGDNPTPVMAELIRVGDTRPNPRRRGGPGVDGTIEFSFRSDPPGASVFASDGTGPVGQTPFSLKRPAADRDRAFVFKLEGYRDQSVMPTGGAIPEVFALLEPDTGARGQDGRNRPRRDPARVERSSLSTDEVTRLLGAARKAAMARRYVAPTGDCVRDYLARIEQAQPGDPDAAALRANIVKGLRRDGDEYLKRRKYDDAEVTFRGIYGLDPRGEDAAAGLALALLARSEVELNRQRYDAAATDAKEAVALGDVSGRGHMTLGEALLKKEAYAEAVEAYRHAVELRPKSKDAKKGLARAEKLAASAERAARGRK